MKWKYLSSPYVAGVWFLILTSSARELRSVYDPPCYFNPICTCSKAIPDLGIVRCQDSFLGRIPQTINTSKAFMLELNNVGLRSMTPHFLQSTGLNKLTITHNPLHSIPDEAFVGLERTLWRLDMSNNALLNVPTRALWHLQKLRYLDLSGNNIVRLHPGSWNGLENSLETLILADNSITHLSPDTFTGLPLLDTINLKGNNLREIDSSVFREGMDKLTTVILADNQLVSIPYLALSPLKMLKYLDLSYNRINKMFLTIEGNVNIKIDTRLSLDLLNLEYNQISRLESGSFQYFNILNKTFLDGNPINVLEDSAFRQARIRELYMRECNLVEVSPNVFHGLENSLQVLDLSGNNITDLANDFLIKFGALRSLSLNDNLLQGFASLEAINGFQHTLFDLNLGGTRGDPISMDTLRRMKSIRVLHIGSLAQRTLSSGEFYEFGSDLEELHINYGGLQTIKNRAFSNLHTLKILDLSENSIDQIEPEAFRDIDHSLTSLICSHGFSSSFYTVPVEALKPLEVLQYLDLSNNKITNVPNNAFHFMKNLKNLLLHDNEIDTIYKGTFQEEIHWTLEVIYLSFNNLKSIYQRTFSNLRALEQLHLDDNRIANLETASFSNMENLKRLNLKGNKISSLPREAFQNLPELEDLDLSFNKLNGFHFNALDQVGTLTTFRLNVSHNKILDLILFSGEDPNGPQLMADSNIKILDLSYNNISHVERHFFRPVELSVTHLYIAHNWILNATRDIFGNMPHLQWLDLSYNRILEFVHDTFKNTRSVQVLLLSHNLIAELPRDVFRTLVNLRVVNLSHNRMRYVPDNLFREEGLERLDLSHNQLSTLPLSGLSYGAAATLCELDLSENAISSVDDADMLSKFERLSWLDLSHNKFFHVDLGVFSVLPKISALDMSYNYNLNLYRRLRTSPGIEDSLLFLKLNNISMSWVPELPLNNLIFLSLAHNNLNVIPGELAGNLTSLRALNLGYNNLTVIPAGIHSLTNLKSLTLAGNPIQVFTNTSLIGVANHLEYLDVADMPLKEFEHSALSKMPFLRSLRLSTYKNVRGSFNIPQVVESNYGLEDLEIHVDRDTSLKAELLGELPTKLRKITITGRALKSISSEIFQGVRSPRLHLTIKDTGLSQMWIDIPNDYRVRNLTLEIENNFNLQTFENPFTASKPGLSRKVFLVDLEMSENRWTCDCSLGWIETWLRKRRQYLCDTNFPTLSPYGSPEYACRHAEDDKRRAVCFNKGNNSLVEVLKTDIECGWSSASANYGFFITYILIVLWHFLTFRYDYENF